MSTSLGEASILAALGGISGYAIAYYIFRKLISEKYNKKSQYSNKIYEWFGFLAMLAIGQGLSTIIIQILVFLISDFDVDINKIARGIVTLIVLPLFLLIFAVVLNTIYARSTLSIAKNQKTPSKPIVKIFSEFVFLKNKAFFLTSIIIFILISCYFLFGEKYFSRDWRFAVSECNVCDWDYGQKIPKCRKSNLKHITVYESKVVFYYTNDEGESSVRQMPSPEDSCLFNVSEKFSFSCNSVINEARQIFTTSAKFDGKESLNQYFSIHMLSQGKMVKALESKSSCKVKG